MTIWTTFLRHVLFLLQFFHWLFLDKIGSFLDPFPQLSPNRQTWVVLKILLSLKKYFFFKLTGSTVGFQSLVDNFSIHLTQQSFSKSIVVKKISKSHPKRVVEKIAEKASPKKWITKNEHLLKKSCKFWYSDYFLPSFSMQSPFGWHFASFLCFCDVKLVVL